MPKRQIKMSRTIAIGWSAPIFDYIDEPENLINFDIYIVKNFLSCHITLLLLALIVLRDFKYRSRSLFDFILKKKIGNPAFQTAF